ncbi:MAG: DUF721 domain-containing protein [Rhodomicrobium sp.]|nr:DUF721 domain-containing protein [Rhodomicrobium sp.]
MAVLPHHGNGAAPQPAFSGPVAVGRFVTPIAGEALSRGGAVLAGLLSQWPAIAGASLAAYTIPAKLTKAAPEPGIAGKNAASMLLLKVDPAKALEVQYAVPQLIERINQALGYKAVAGLRLVQAPIHNRAKKASPKVAPPKKIDAGASRLGSALARMAAGLKARGANG